MTFSNLDFLATEKNSKKMSADTPVDPAESQAQDSVQPSQPVDHETKHVPEDAKLGSVNGEGNGDAGSIEDSEMDTKAKALMHLLNTSEVHFPPLAALRD